MCNRDHERDTEYWKYDELPSHLNDKVSYRLQLAICIAALIAIALLWRYGA